MTARKTRARRPAKPSPREIVHGVLMEIDTLGVLILGESGIGKSESALELIDRGHRLVADDVVEIRKESRGLVGRSPDLTRHYMELRGLGIVNVKDLFGAAAIRRSKAVDLVIRLERWEEATDVERLGVDLESYVVLGTALPLVKMPVGPGRNLAMLVEVAARNHRLKRSGRHGARLLVGRASRLSARDRRASGEDKKGRRG